MSAKPVWIVVDVIPEGKWDIVWRGDEPGSANSRNAARDVVAMLGHGHVIMTECDAGLRNPNTFCRYHNKRHGEA